MRIVDVCEITKPIASPIRNAYIDFSKMTTSLVAVVTDVVRDGRRVVGYGFNSNGRYGQGGLIRERFRDRILEAAPESLLDESATNLDPYKIWATMMMNEKPGGPRTDRQGLCDEIHHRGLRSGKARAARTRGWASRRYSPTSPGKPEGGRRRAIGLSGGGVSQ
jgi:hypothetical protein